MFSSISFKDGRPFFGGYFLDQVYTHAGVFHADDVFCSALIRCLYPDVKIHRCAVLPKNLPEGTLSFDLLGAPFDHHGTVRQRRRNGQIYSSFGLMWSSLGKALVPDLVTWQGVDTSLVQLIDCADNGGVPCFVSEMILGMNSESSDPNESFDAAVALAIQLLHVTLHKYDIISKALALIRPQLDAAANAGSVFVELPFYRADLVPYIRELAPTLKYIVSPDVAEPVVDPYAEKYVIRSLSRSVSFRPTVIKFCVDCAKSSGLSKILQPMDCGLTFVHPSGSMLVCRDRSIAQSFFSCHLNRLGLCPAI